MWCCNRFAAYFAVLVWMSCCYNTVWEFCRCVPPATENLVFEIKVYNVFDTQRTNQVTSDRSGLIRSQPVGLSTIANRADVNGLGASSTSRQVLELAAQQRSARQRFSALGILRLEAHPRPAVSALKRENREPEHPSRAFLPRLLWNHTFRT